MTGPASRRRKAVFDPTALDDLDATLAPPEPAPAPAADSQPEVHPAPETGRPKVPPKADPPASRTSVEGSAGPAPTARAAAGTSSEREQGGPSERARPTKSNGAARTPSRQQRSARGRVPTAVRLPADLYRQVNEVLLSGTERPSYGQLVMWTVEDHRAEVTEQVEGSLPNPTDRVPRGRKLAEDRTPVTLQLLHSERDHLDDLADGVAERSEGARVTRTDVAVAALTVALRVRTN